MIWHSESAAAVLTHLRTDRDTGLTAEAVTEYHKQHRKNARIPQNDSFGVRFWRCLKRPAVIAILALSLAAIGYGLWETTKYRTPDFFTPATLILLTLARCIAGAATGRRTAASTAHAFATAHVRRNGQLSELSAAQLIPGDIIEVTAGDTVPADCRLLSSFELRCDESLLTDEFLPVRKDADTEISAITPLAKRTNMLYADCPVLQGHGVAVVVETGERTAHAQRAHMHKPRSHEFPQQSTLQKAGHTLASVGLLAGLFTAVLALIADTPFLSALLLGTAVSVALMPEELEMLAPAVWRASIRRLAAHGTTVSGAESMNTLGRVDVLVADKNGLFTQNNLTLVRTFAGGRMVKMDQNRPPKDLNTLLQLSLLCADGNDTSAAALADYLDSHGVNTHDLTASYPQLAYAPATDTRRRAVSVHLVEGQYIVVVKGAPEEVLPLCGAAPDGLADAEEFMAAETLCTFAVAYKTVSTPPAPFLPEEAEQGVSFLGLLGFSDPPHEDTAVAVAKCAAAGIRLVMMTDDSLAAARATARRVGLLTDAAQAISGAELAAMSDSELSTQLSNIRVCARATAGDKSRLITAWRACGNVVAATAVSPAGVTALGAANIGCAVAEDPSFAAGAEVTLKNTRLSALIDSVATARAAMDNLHKLTAYRLASGLSTLLLVILALLFRQSVPLPEIALVWSGLVLSLLPRFALSREPAERSVLHRMPRRERYDVFKNAMPGAVLQGLLLSALTTFALIAHGSTAALAVWGVGQTLLLWSLRSSQPLVRSFPLRAPWAWVMGVLTLVLLSLPFALQILPLPTLSGTAQQAVLLLLLAYLLICEAGKYLLALLRRR